MPEATVVRILWASARSWLWPMGSRNDRAFGLGEGGQLSGAYWVGTESLRLNTWEV